MFTVVAYRRLGQWRWRAIATNGRKLAHGGEGYANRADLLASLAILWPDQPVTFR